MSYNPTIYCSVGHDAKRKGAYNEKYDLHEYDINVETTQYLAEELIEMGLKVSKVYSDRLSSAIKEINKTAKSTDIAIEMHVNALSNPNVRGCEVMYFKGSKNGNRIAFHVQNAMRAFLGQQDKKNDARDDLSFLERTVCAAIIPEPFFLSNEADVQRFLLNDREANLRNISYAIAIGVKDFINERNR